MFCSLEGKYFQKKNLINQPTNLLTLMVNYCDLRGQIKRNAEGLYHELHIAHVSVQYDLQ